MATLPRSRAPYRPSAQTRVRSLLRLNDAVQKINSILELDVLLDKIVNEIASAFGCLEAMVLLKDAETNEVCVAAVMGCSQCVKRDRFTIGIDGLVGYVAATGMTLYTPDVTQEPRYIACEPETRSELDIPLIANGDVIGVFSTQHPEIDGFPAEQRALLEALAGHIAVAIANARLFQHEREERTRMRQQESEAHRIQQALFPRGRPQIAGFQVEGHCLPAGAVGGDYYDFMPLQSDGRQLWGLVLADVSGKGMAAALLMSSTRAIMRSITKHFVRPSAVLERMNRALVEDLPAEQFVTMVYAVLDPLDHTVTYANAGHPWPIFATDGGTRFLLTDSGLPLGIKDGPYDEHTIAVPPGSCMLLYSDGVSEASSDGEEYGLERLKHDANCSTVSAEGIVQQVRDFCGGGPLADDATAVVIKSEA